MRTLGLVGTLVLLAATQAAAQQAAPAQPAADPSTTQPASAQTGASPVLSDVVEPTARASSIAPAAADPTDVTERPDAAAVDLIVVDWSSTKPGDAAAGEAKAAACGACHGLDGNAADPMYPKLAGQHEMYVARQLALYKSGERPNPIMHGFAAPLSPQDMRDLGAFYAGKAVIPGVASDAPIAADGGETWVARGAALYRGGDAADGTPACMACHGPTGRGNPGARYPALGGQHTDYTKARLLEFRSGAVWGAGENASPIMAEIARTLTDEDIEALSTYLEGIHPAASGATAGSGGAR